MRKILYILQFFSRHAKNLHSATKYKYVLQIMIKYIINNNN